MQEVSRVTSRVFKNNRYTDLGKTVAATSLFVQIVLQQPLTHIFYNLDESQVSEEKHTLNIPAGDRVKAFFSLYLLFGFALFLFCL